MIAKVENANHSYNQTEAVTLLTANLSIFRKFRYSDYFLLNVKIKISNYKFRNIFLHVIKANKYLSYV